MPASKRPKRPRPKPPRDPAAPLLDAQQASLQRHERLNTLGLRPVSRKVQAVDVVNSLTRAEVSLTIAGASQLELDVFDPAREVEQSGLLDKDQDGRLDAVAVTVDHLRFRLTTARRSTDTLTLVFEDEVFALLRAHRKPIASSRAAVTRAQFIERMVREVKVRDIPFYAPEKGRKQPREHPDLPDAKPRGQSTGFDKGTRLTVKGWSGTLTLDAERMRNAATMLATAEQESADPKATLALIEAGIVEAPFFANPAGGDRDSVGILQLRSFHMGGSTSTNGGRRDVAAVSRLFLTKGFSGKGGAIALARANPGWSAGQVAQAVQGSAFPARYDQSREGAQTVMDGHNGGDAGVSTHEAVRIKSYRFTRGLPGERENSVQAADRLASEVQWRFFASGGVAWFVNDYWLLTRAADVVLKGYQAPGLLEWPGYEWDHRKLAASVSLRVAANAWGVRPGSIAVLDRMGPPLNGRWIVETFTFDLLDPLAATVDLTKPTAPKKEPAPEVFTVAVGDDGVVKAGAGAKAAIAWARSKIGHYGEDLGSNRGQELDALERTFGLHAAPWCAMFATTALVMGGVTRDCRHAYVPTIRQWCQEGSHGYQRGFKGTAQPGDLIAYGGAHIGLVVKVNGATLNTIEGNYSDRVVTRTVARSSGDIIRPEYPEEA